MEPRAGTTPAGARCQDPASQLEHRVAAVRQRLVQALLGLLEDPPGRPQRAVEISRASGINHDLARKLLIATAKRDALTATNEMPGPEAVRPLTRAAGRKRIRAQIIDAAAAAVRRTAISTATGSSIWVTCRDC